MSEEGPDQWTGYREGTQTGGHALLRMKLEKWKLDAGKLQNISQNVGEQSNLVRI